jgi:multiple sugar transport system permease protein
MEAGSVAVRPKQKKRRPSGFSESRLGAAMMAPSLIVMGLVAAFPIGYAVWLSLNEYSVRVEGLSRFVGFDNYADELWGDSSSEFWDAFQNTFIFTGISVTVELVLGIAFALCMHQAFKGRALLRATVLVPWAVLTFGVGLLWRSIFEPNLGFWPSMLEALGLPGADVLWYGEDGYAMATIIFADVWKTAPFMALLILAGLQVIPEDVYDAAKVDGATAWQRFTRITLPLLRPAILVALLFRTLDALRVFDLPFALTRGSNGTTTLSLYSYQELQGNRLIGEGSTIAVLTFVIVMVVSFLYIRFVGGNIRAMTEAE